ncbi:putative flippase GtrA [Propionicimonas paludicola]|uniref:Putative flippase GtrA n=1 Tax=Propionicimonas paludicola TaxID=185243 RepID=A0A2A9CTF0_9ACTN|nr:GtrA family protein [Propionicimonas paludicola]PFG17737.1 putative flippase GtrA [Propionicimonas paludicola]
MPVEHGALSWWRRLLADQRVRFLIVGGANTVFSTALFIGFDLWFGRMVYSFVPLVLAWVISLVCVFFLHRGLVFRVHGHLLRDLGRFAVVNSGTLAINIGALFVVSDLLGWPRIPWQLGITAAMVVASFIGHKYFSFKRTSAELDVDQSDIPAQ